MKPTLYDQGSVRTRDYRAVITLRVMTWLAFFASGVLTGMQL